MVEGREGTRGGRREGGRDTDDISHKCHRSLCVLVAPVSPEPSHIVITSQCFLSTRPYKSIVDSFYFDLQFAVYTQRNQA